MSQGEDRGISPTPSIAVDRNRRNPNSKPRKKQTGMDSILSNLSKKCLSLHFHWKVDLGTFEKWEML